ncbi:MAG: hypothetical protein QOD99_2822 [Chthoniobacter sp.]|jgi:hypothetical protein|nr:hypothetical protein [Chthoniobacter sp.]
MSNPTFIIDCPWCKAKVAANEKGRAERSYFDDDAGEPNGYRLYVGSCPSCSALLAGEATQVGFEGYDSDSDVWTDVVRVFPKPGRTFSSTRIPRVVRDSLLEADRSLQANANIAACVMLGRALEAVCRDLLEPIAPASPPQPAPPLPGPPQPPSATPTPASPAPATAALPTPPPKKKKIMLAEGIRQLKDKKFIDERLYDWSQQLHAFRNLAAHPEDVSISRDDAEDLQTFVYAIVEYIYDLTDRYNEFKNRLDKRNRRKRA